MVRVRRVYDPAEPGADGVRVLVDRLWPRGLSKEAAAVDDWPRALTPSAGLRRWFHAGGSAGEFRRRYEAELGAPEAVAELERLRGLAARGPLTLLTAARNPESGHAAVLAELLAGRDVPPRHDG
ncbi:DUF488 domain-containing protein [Streptomyces sp. cmx-4-9]|uniref:DUF488 domain-containing protein n=1 Tax=Streptomyces sp. cmx-4-9 TaxID=2790941 RepID=UPI0039800F5D